MAALALVLLSAALILPWLGEGRLVAEEPKRVIIAQQMLAEGNWLLPELYGEPYVTKPPLANWQIAFWTAVLGHGEFAARVGSWVMLVILVLGLLWVLRTLLAPAALVMLAVALMSQRELVAKAQIAEIDLQFTALVSLALWTWFARRERGLTGVALWWPTTLLSILSFLSKGPLGPLALVLGIGAWLLMRRERLRELGWFALSQLLVFGLWLGGMLAAVGREPFHVMLAMEAETRAPADTLLAQAGAAIGLITGWVASILPWALFLPLLLVRRYRELLTAPEQRMVNFALITAAINVLPYLPIDNSSRYLLPLTPSLLIVCVLALESLRRRPQAGRYPRLAFWLIMLLSLIGLLAWPVETLLRGRPHLMHPLMVAGLAAVGLSAWLLIARRRRQLGPAAAAGCALFLTLFHLIDVDIVRQRTIDRDHTRRNPVMVLDQVAAIAGPGPATVAVVGRPPEDLYYYDRRHLLRQPAAGREGADYVLVMASEQAKVPADAEPVAAWTYKSDDQVLLFRN